MRLSAARADSSCSAVMSACRDLSLSSISASKRALSISAACLRSSRSAAISSCRSRRSVFHLTVPQMNEATAVAVPTAPRMIPARPTAELSPLLWTSPLPLNPKTTLSKHSQTNSLARDDTHRHEARVGQVKTLEVRYASDAPTRVATSGLRLVNWSERQRVQRHNHQLRPPASGLPPAYDMRDRTHAHRAQEPRTPRSGRSTLGTRASAAAEPEPVPSKYSPSSTCGE